MKKELNLKFLNREMVEKCAERVLEVTIYNEDWREKYGNGPVQGYLVVIVPKMVVDEKLEWPESYSLKPHAIFQKSLGDRKKWPRNFEEIAKSRALQLWQGRSPVGDEYSTPYLLFEGDEPHNRGFADGTGLLVVSFSGYSYDGDLDVSRFLNEVLIGESCQNFCERFLKNHDKDFV